MATNRKLGKTTDIRLSMLKTQVTDLLWHGKIETTETRAKETKAIADSLIALAVKEAGNWILKLNDKRKHHVGLFTHICQI